MPPAAREDALDVFFSPAYSCPLSLDVPRVTAVHDLSFFAHPQDFAFADALRRRVLVRLSLRASRLVPVCSDFTRRELARLFPDVAERAVHVPLGPDDDLPPPPPRDEARARLGIRGPYVITVGAVLNRRCAPELLRAVARLAQPPPRPRPRRVGENRTHPRLDLAARVRTLGLEAHVRLSGFVDEAGARRPLRRRRRRGLPLRVRGLRPAGPRGRGPRRAPRRRPRALAGRDLPRRGAPRGPARRDRGGGGPRPGALGRGPPCRSRRRGAGARRPPLLGRDRDDGRARSCWRPPGGERRAPAGGRDRVLRGARDAARRPRRPARPRLLPARARRRGQRQHGRLGRRGPRARTRRPSSSPTPENVGFARACNQGWRASRAPHVLFLNPDAEVTPGAVETLVGLLESRPAVGAVGPRTRSADGTIQVSTGPDLTPLAELRQRRLVLGVARREPGRSREAEALHAREHEPAWVSGSCLIARRAALEAVGGFDEGFFLYEEDADLCRRLRQAGWRVVFTPAAEVRHQLGRSMSKAPRRARLEYHRSHLRYYRKHNGPPRARRCGSSSPAAALSSGSRRPSGRRAAARGSARPPAPLARA